jgi:hypothetical protein
MTRQKNGIYTWVTSGRTAAFFGGYMPEEIIG